MLDVPVVPPFISTEKITVDVPSLKFTGVVLMFASDGRRLAAAGVARDQVRALARQLGDHVLVDERVRRLDDAEADEQQQRQDDRELDDALPASARASRVSRRCAGVINGTTPRSSWLTARAG